MMMLMCYAFAKAQLGFCNDASDQPIFVETFGAGTTNGPPLTTTQTSYQFVNSNVQDGQYTVSSNLRQLDSWHTVDDHTGDANGKALVVNASFEPDQFYQTTINGLCGNTNYEFSAWIINLLDGSPNVCEGREVPVQVRFEIWDATDTNRLAQGVMDPQFASDNPPWEQYGLVFTSAAGQDSCILKMINEGAGGCGNDLAIDDIVFRTCGDVAQIVDTADRFNDLRCANDPSESIDLSVTTSESVFDTPAYQWQSSTDGVNFLNIPGANEPTYTTDAIETTTFYRVQIAEDATNLNTVECSNFSDVFTYEVINVASATPVSSTVTSCEMTSGLLEVTVPDGVTTDWYDAPIGGNLLLEDSNDLQVTDGGLYYAQARDVRTGCTNTSRTAIEFTVSMLPAVSGENILKCPTEEVLLDPMFDGMATYEWSSGERSPTITVIDAGVYTCEVTNSDGCSSTATFDISIIDAPQILELIENGDQLEVVTNPGNFLYRANGGNFTRNNQIDISGLLQINVEVTDLQQCTTVSMVYNRLGIPDFFTPNFDSFNDTWTVGNLQSFPGASVAIFDRYGKLIKTLTESGDAWDGTFNNQLLPSSDYWYLIEYENQKIRGHFSLKR
jgi:gliding motility-associated-like protein